MPLPLHPCPFCGEAPELDVPDKKPGGTHYYTVACNGERCAMQPETPGKLTEQEAADAWNTRPTPVPAQP